MPSLFFANHPLQCLLLCFIVLATRHTACSDQQPPQDKLNFVVAGYLPEYRAYININNTAPFLTDLILFSLAPDHEGKLGSCCLESSNFHQARQARAYKKEQFPGTYAKHNRAEYLRGMTMHGICYLIRGYLMQRFFALWSSEKDPLKLWMSIGGAGRSNSYRIVASDASLRTGFIQTLKEKW